MHMWTLPVWPALTFSNSSKNNSYICYTMSVFWTSNFADTDLLSVCDWGQFFIRDLWNTHKATLFKLNKSQNPFMRAQHGLSLQMHLPVQSETGNKLFSSAILSEWMLSPHGRTMASWLFCSFWLISPLSSPVLWETCNDAAAANITSPSAILFFYSSSSFNPAGNFPDWR